MTIQSIFEARELATSAGETIAALRQGEARLREQPALEEEREWLAAAIRRVSRELGSTEGALGMALPLPELEAERQTKARASFQAWVDSVEALLFGITAHVSGGNPVIEVLFPHQNFEKVRRAGTAARSYMSDFERRRATTYVLRMATEPAYAFLPPLLATVDEARARLAVDEAPITLDAVELDALRRSVLDAAGALGHALSQARLLAEAALMTSPGLFTELGLQAKPRKRPARLASAALS
jgi:hypothetical protein